MDRIMHHAVYKDTKDMEDAKFYVAKDAEGLAYWTVPVGVEEFILSDNYLGLSGVIRPVVLQDLKDLFCDESAFAYCPYEEAVFDEAIGTGKSYKTSISTTYYLYHLTCLKNPQIALNMDTKSIITIMNMSINAIQAKKVVFEDIKAKILYSPWFSHFPPDPKIMSELKFGKGINIIPGHSGELFPLGYNLICAIMDEASFYTETQSHDVAEDMFYALKRRIQSRFGDKGLLIMISSPRYADDFIERKMAEAKNDPRIFSRRHAIWEVVPEDIEAVRKGDVFTLNETNIPNKYKKDFEKNPEKSWRDLGAVASLTLEAYFKEMDKVEACIDPNLKHPIDGQGRYFPWFKGKEGVNYYIHVDLGLTGDACGFAMGHYDGENSIIDLKLQIKPEMGKEIDIRGIVDKMLELRSRGFKIKKATYDQFQSAGSIQELKKEGIKAERISVDKGLEGYDTFKEQLYQNKVRMYKHEVLMGELRRLEMIKGKKVDHPPKGHKDVADAVCGVVFNIVTNELHKRMIQVS